MAENTKIEWCDHTWNPWVGCTKISSACDNCYAESWSKRSGRDVWGPHAERQRTKTWGNPIKRNKKLEGTGRREKVFVASLADVFDNHKSIQPEWRAEMWDVIKQCSNLDFLLLTKRPQNIARYLPDDWDLGYSNVWLGTTVENQTEAERRIPRLLNVPAQLRFLSCEPLLGDIRLDRLFHDHPAHTDALNGMYHGCDHRSQINKIDWVIAGGESGPNARPSHPDWFRSLRDQCEAANVPFLFKQWGEWSPCEISNIEESSNPGPAYPIKGNGCTGHKKQQEVLFWQGEKLAQWPHIKTVPVIGARKTGKKSAGRLLDGVEHNAMPQVSSGGRY